MKWRVLVRKISRGSHIKSRVIETIAADQNNFLARAVGRDYLRSTK